MAAETCTRMGPRAQLTMTARERLAEYATMKALDFPPGFVMRLLFGESLLIALAGGVAGLLITLPLAVGFAGLEDEPYRHRGRVSACCLSAGTPLVAGSPRWQTLVTLRRSAQAMKPAPTPCLEISMLKPLAVSFRPTALAVAAASMLLALPAQATVVLDTFGPGDLANGAGWSLTNGVDAPGQFLAVSFTLAEASIITDILTSISGDGTYNLGIVAGAGLPSGAYVFSTALNNPTAISAATGLNWTLDAGAYWLVSRPEAGTFGSWSGGGQPGNAWAYTSNGTWFSGGDFDAPAARITVTAVPEPGTWALMLGGLALCAAAVRRQRG